MTEYYTTFMDSLTNLNQQTIKNHKNQYKIYVDTFQQFPSFDEVVVINNIKSLGLNDSKTLSLLKSISKYRSVNQLTNIRLLRYMKETNDALSQKYKIRNKELKNSLPKYKDVMKKLNELHKNQEHKRYIINYLMINLSTRNQDLDVKIVKKKTNTDGIDNFLVLRKNDVLFIRNKFKTAFSTGAKQNIIKSKKFYQSVKSFLYDDEMKELFEFDKLTSNNMGVIVRKYTIDAIKETDMLKIVLSAKNSLSQANKISNNRGSALSTLQSNYNVLV